MDRRHYFFKAPEKDGENRDVVWPKVMKKLCGLLFMAGFLIIMFLGATGQDDGRVCKMRATGNRAENEKAVGRLVREILEIKMNILKSEMLEIGIEVPAVETEVSAIETEKDLEKMKTEQQYFLKEAEDGYELTFYDKDGREVYSQWYPRSTYLSEVTPNVLKIDCSIGSPACYVEFFDRETAEISPVYFNPIMISDKYIAFMEEDGILVLSDLFQRGELYMEIRRDFTGFANRIGAIRNIELLDDRHVEIEYYEGEYESEEFTETTEVITLD